MSERCAHILGVLRVALNCCLVMSLSCRGADVRVVSAQPLGLMEKPASIDGRDGGTSGLFQGRSVWVYGDSVATATGTYPSTWRNNTMSWTADLHAADGITGFTQPEDTTGAAKEFFPRTADEEAYNASHLDRGDGSCASPCGGRYAIWGSGPLMDASGRALLAYSKVNAAPGDFNFFIVGTSIAVWNDFESGPERPTTDAGLSDPTLLFDKSEGEFGIPVLSDDALYLFSCSGDRSAHGECRLARATVAQIFHRSAWQFATGHGWSSDVTEAASLFSGTPNMTVYWNAHLDRWIAIYITYGRIVVRTALHLEGPWSGETKVFSPPEDGAEHALGHVEYQEDGGATEYISYLADQFRLVKVRLERP